MLRLKPVIEGNRAGPTLVFAQGWPDDLSLWNEQVSALAARYRCVRVDFPNYGDGERTRRAYHTDEIVEALAALVDEASPDAPVTLIAHDWGAYWGYRMHHQHPRRIARLVGLDVAPHYRPTPGAMAGILLYQSWLYLAFELGGPVGDAMTRRLGKWARVPQAADLDAWMNYPYRNAWQDIFSGRLKRGTEGYWPTIPLLFVYGARKPFQFHSQNWLDHVERQPGGKVVALPSGHWVTRAPEFTAILLDWLEATARYLPERPPVGASEPSARDLHAGSPSAG